MIVLDTDVMVDVHYRDIEGLKAVEPYSRS
jgi:hypothetical protein